MTLTNTTTSAGISLPTQGGLVHNRTVTSDTYRGITPPHTGPSGRFHFQGTLTTGDTSLLLQPHPALNATITNVDREGVLPPVQRSLDL